jgi:hypothetical protein
MEDELEKERVEGGGEALAVEEVVMQWNDLAKENVAVMCGVGLPCTSILGLVLLLKSWD